MEYRLAVLKFSVIKEGRGGGRRLFERSMGDPTRKGIAVTKEGKDGASKNFKGQWVTQCGRGLKSGKGRGKEDPTRKGIAVTKEGKDGASKNFKGQWVTQCGRGLKSGKGRGKEDFLKGRWVTQRGRGLQSPKKERTGQVRVFEGSVGDSVWKRVNNLENETSKDKKAGEGGGRRRNCLDKTHSHCGRARMWSTQANR